MGQRIKTIREAIRTMVSIARALPLDTLKTLIQKGPALVAAAVPLPKTDEEVGPWMTKVGISEPAEPVATALIQLYLPSADVVGSEPYEADPELGYLVGASDEGQRDYLVAIAREEILGSQTGADGVVQAIDPATIALILQLVQTLGPVLIEWFRNRRKDRDISPLV